MPSPVPNPLPVPCPVAREGGSAALERIRGVMADAGFLQSDVTEQLDLPSILALATKTRSELLARAAGDTARDVLIRLFTLAEPVDPDTVACALGASLRDDFHSFGFIRLANGGDRATVSITPVRGLWIASDIAKSGELRPSDFVMGIGTSTQTLDTLTVRRRCDRALDLGTGCGYHALLAAVHAETVIGTDINPRAIRMATLNAAINDVLNVQWRLGSFYEPVSRETFDLVVSNPPFVISPENAHVYRSAGMSGDGVTETVVRGAAQSLNPGGIAQFLCNWAHLKGTDWHDRLAGWVEGSGCDLLVLRSETLEADEYAAYWVQHTREESSEPLAERVNRWRASYAELGIEAASIGLVLLRKRMNASDSPWARFDDAPRSMLGGASAAVLRRIEVEDALQDLSDAELLNASLRISNAVRIEHTLRPTDGGWGMEHASARLVEGLAYATGTDEGGMHILMQSDGSTPLRAILMQLAPKLGCPFDEVAPTILSMVRSMVRRGYLDLPGSG